jgi:hypothetical protein
LTPFDTNWKKGSGATPLTTQDLFCRDELSIPTAPTSLICSESLTQPLLGSVVLGNPSGSQANPDLGEIVIVDSAPATDSDPFLGTINEDI